MFGELKTPEGIRNDQKVIDHSNLPRWPPSTCFGHVKARTWSRLSSRLFQILVTHFSYVYTADAAAAVAPPQVPLDTKRMREREKERRGERGRRKRGKVEKREERKKLRTERRGVIVLFSTLFEIVVLSALCSSSQVFFLQARGETKDKLQRRPSCDPSHLSINDLVQSRENESTSKADTGGKSVIRTTWSRV